MTTTIPFYHLNASHQALKARKWVLRHKSINERLHNQTLEGGIKIGKFKWNPAKDIKKGIDGVTRSVSGLAKAAERSIKATIKTVQEIGKAINTAVRFAVGDVKWSDVLDSLGSVYRNIGNVLATINPTRLITNFIKELPIAGQAFNELDRFSGGLLTNLVNVSDLPYRAMRGDPISKQELLMDIIAIIQVATIIVGGPALWAAIQFQNQVCSSQSDPKKCGDAFSALRIYAGDYTPLFDAGTQELIRSCQRQKWAGSEECRVTGAALNLYANAYAQGNPPPLDQFLVEQVSDIGTKKLLSQWFPEKSPQGEAFRLEVERSEQTIKLPSKGAGVFLAAAGIAALLLVGS